MTVSILESVEVELREIRIQKSGINPELPSYAKLEAREEELKGKLEYSVPDPYKRCKTIVKIALK